jgi:hypothetical protein
LPGTSNPSPCLIRLIFKTGLKSLLPSPHCHFLSTILVIFFPPSSFQSALFALPPSPTSTLHPSVGVIFFRGDRYRIEVWTQGFVLAKKVL